jgi:hypothetical protein
MRKTLSARPKRFQTRPLRLAVDLLPRSLWGRSLAKTLAWHAWRALRDDTLMAYAGRCAFCGASPAGHVHERWEYRTRTRTATVAELFLVCVDCHACIHWGRSQKVCRAQELDRLIAHFCTVNQCDTPRFNIHLQSAASAFYARDEIAWTVIHPESVRIKDARHPIPAPKEA